MDHLPFPASFVYGPPDDFTPRDWHEECADNFFRALDGRKEKGPFHYLVSAGVGAGKTALAAMLSARLLTTRVVERIVYVSPNRAIKEAVRSWFRRFKIHLTDWNNKKHAEGEPAGCQGAVLTYQSLAKNPALQQAVCCRRRTLVIFDEIHHLGDQLEWGEAAATAFGDRAVAILGLTGTPFRGDNREIPFVTVETCPSGLRRYRADYSYPLGRAIAQGICRHPIFRWSTGDVSVTDGASSRTYGIDSDMSDETASLVLSGFVRPGSRSRTDMLRLALEECRGERRKAIIFVGGDSGADTLATDDASKFLPDELRALGLGRDEFVSVVSQDSNAHGLLKTFGKSNAWVLVSVNMVSEGVDIPELSAGIFLTSITAKSTTIQRWGRALRGPGTALFYKPRDRRFVQTAEEAMREIDAEIPFHRPRDYDPERVGAGAAVHRRRPDAIGLFSVEGGMTFNGQHYTREDVDRARAHCARCNMPTDYHWVGMTLQIWRAAGGQSL